MDNPNIENLQEELRKAIEKKEVLRYLAEVAAYYETKSDEEAITAGILMDEEEFYRRLDLEEMPPGCILRIQRKGEENSYLAYFLGDLLLGDEKVHVGGYKGPLMR